MYVVTVPLDAAKDCYGEAEFVVMIDTHGYTIWRYRVSWVVKGEAGKEFFRAGQFKEAYALWAEKRDAVEGVVV